MLQRIGSKGALKGLADAEGYEEFVVPDAIGGRFSVLTTGWPAPTCGSRSKHSSPHGGC